MRKFGMVIMLAMVAMLAMSSASYASETVVPGHKDKKQPGQVVNGKYTSVYIYDASGAYYWDLGDGRIYTSKGVASPADLDQGSLTTCDYVVIYRGDFGSDPSLDSGWIKNNIHCYGFDGNSTYNSTIVHESDPRYTDNPEYAIWGDWEYHVDTVSGSGNQIRPMGPAYHVGD